MKKILFISGRMGGGGSERVLTLLANRMSKQGYEVGILTFGQTQNPYENDCPVTILRFHNDFDQILQLRKAVKKYSPDVVIAFEYYVGMKTILATRVLPVKVIISERNDPHKLDGQPLKKWLRNCLYAFSHVIVCQTNDAKEYFHPRIRQKTVVICNPVKDNLPVWKPDQNHKVIVNFCRLEKQKNIPLLIEAFEIVCRKHPDYQLWLFGEGSEQETLHSLISKKGMGQQVKLSPFCSNIHEIVSQCSMFVSSSDYEGISNSMLEAMAIGMPVICTDCPIGGAKMTIQNGHNGILVPVNDTQRLASAMLNLIENPEHAMAMGDNARHLREKISLDKITEEWIKIL
jgi:glycosyltransferase involved in cell wall biosynthesis